MSYTTLTFDLIKIYQYGCNITYGFVFGRDRQKIFLIKTGQDGTINGYQNKYLKLACELRDKYGFSVVCASTPSSDIDQMAQFAEIVKSEFNISKATKIYFMGMSKGASIGCLKHASFPQISRFLLINPPLMINTTKICRRAQEFTGEMMTFVFGSLDPSAHLAGLLKLHERENIRVAIVPGQDHHFSKDGFELLNLLQSTVLRTSPRIKTFIHGSVSAELPNFVKSILDLSIENGDEILVGDDDGIDILVQKHLASKRYNNVTIYCKGIFPQNNFVASAKIRSCAGATQGLPDDAVRVVHKKQMADDCNQAFWISDDNVHLHWDGINKTVADNIHHFEKMNMPISVSIGSCKDIFTPIFITHVDYSPIDTRMEDLD